MRRLLGARPCRTRDRRSPAGAVLAPGGSRESERSGRTTKKVTVTATEFKYKFSRTNVPIGTVVFTVVNKGKIAHDFKVLGKKTPTIAPGKSAKLTVRFTKRGRYAYLCTLPGHAKAGMKGVSRSARLRSP